MPHQTADGVPACCERAHNLSAKLTGTTNNDYSHRSRSRIQVPARIAQTNAPKAHSPRKLPKLSHY